MENLVCLIGRLTADIELQNYGKGKNGGVYTRFSLAVNDGKDSEGESKALFVQCTAFNGSAEILDEYCGKGDMVAIQGRLAMSEYDDKDGNHRKYLYVSVSNVKLLPNGDRKNSKKK